MSDMPYISIIIPAYNAEKTIEHSLRELRKQDYPKDKYEIIVVNDASCDNTSSIAKKSADKVIEHTKNLGETESRLSGIKIAKGDIIVNTDSDIILPHRALQKIADYFSRHKEVDALTGLLSKQHPNADFFSQYKNLYMHYIFMKLPERVTFLYGSIHAFRKDVPLLYKPYLYKGGDTEFGQELVERKKEIAFLKDLEVVHFKRHTFFSFVKNDFFVPFYWARIFLMHKGWRQLGKNKTGFAHSPKEQLLSVILAPVILLLIILGIIGHAKLLYTASLGILWILFNMHFFAFLLKERGFYFATLAIFVTFLDNIVMALGITSGFTVALIKR